MSELVPADRIEEIVGVRRSMYQHIGRLVTTEGVVYIMHSRECLELAADLRDCPYSLALDQGTDLNRWAGDEPMLLAIHEGWLVPV